MPKETFMNLPKAKQDLIEQIAMSMNLPSMVMILASINRIVSAAGIAKGSFYQYFEDKRDLFIMTLNQ